MLAVRLQPPQGLRLTNRYTASDCDVLAMPRTPLKLLATENKQEQDKQVNNSRKSSQRLKLNHELGVLNQANGWSNRHKRSPGSSCGSTNPLELFRLKRASHHYTSDTNSTHFRRNNPWVCRVIARFNHGFTGPSIGLPRTTASSQSYHIIIAHNF
jgi:hypothetical protein